MNTGDARTSETALQPRAMYMFQLTATLAPAGHAKGKVFRLSPDSSPVLSTREYDFYDMIGDRSGSSGSKGYAVAMPDGKLHIIDLTCG